MIIDSSAILAILFGEPDAKLFSDAISGAPRCRMLTANWFEVAMNVDAPGDAWASRRLDEFIETARIELLPFTETYALRARHAWLQFGRGRHKARLNFGDCMAYSAAKVEGEKLLYKGNDFAQTDIDSAL